MVKYSFITSVTQPPNGLDEEANISVRLGRSMAQDHSLGYLISQPSRQTFTNGGLDDCSVCTEAFQKTDEVRVLPCGHIFHHGCIDRWLLSFAGTCPTWYVVLAISNLMIIGKLTILYSRIDLEDAMETLTADLNSPKPAHCR